ncbi:hypothetical protein [Planococcus lenghuensis]|uniref:Uncharacterized protein n=1 Tax=Planococcus lenghuensis TaxID=2213202 RepID=A0A1Q2L0E4_9BACL|nr:hypothetical protein [Planococcus lenghuensis]AQQ53527.1 hypothetical protein B0X71_10890 [Planococcus lenghuensis]
MARGKYQEWLTEEGLLKLEGWARDGLMDEQIDQNMGTGRQPLYDWKNKYLRYTRRLKKEGRKS